jgi:hypothetical protein
MDIRRSGPSSASSGSRIVAISAGWRFGEDRYGGVTSWPVRDLAGVVNRELAGLVKVGLLRRRGGVRYVLPGEFSGLTV